MTFDLRTFVTLGIARSTPGGSVPQTEDEMLAIAYRSRFRDRLYDATILRLRERWAATKMLVRPDTWEAVYVERRYLWKALTLVWLLPVRWCYPDWPTCKHCDQICGYDEVRLGGEYNSWEASFVAIPLGWRLGRAHIYRDGGP